MTRTHPRDELAATRRHRVMAALAALCAILLATSAPAQTLVSRLHGDLVGMRVDVRVSSEPVRGGYEIVVTNGGDDAHVALGCLCDRGVLLSEIAPLPEPDWPDDRIVFVFSLKRGETSRVMLAVPGKLREYEIPLIVLSDDKTIATRTTIGVYDGIGQ